MPMRIKSYFARTVEDAMAQARQELGPEAMLVNSRKAAPEARDLGEYEVVFAADQGSAPAAKRPAALAQPFGDRLSMEVAELKREVDGMRRTLTRSAFATSQWLSSSPDLSEAYAVLTSNEVAPELAREIVQSAAAGAGANGAAFRRALAEESGIAHRGGASAGPRGGPAAHRSPGGAARVRQDHDAGEAGGELRSGRAPARAAAVHGHLSGSGRGAVTILRRHPRGRFPRARNGDGVVAGDRGESREGLDFHRHPGLRIRRHGSFRAARRFPGRQERYRYATGPIVLDEIRRSYSCGGFVRKLPAATAAVYQARRDGLLRPDPQ